MKSLKLLLIVLVSIFMLPISAMAEEREPINVYLFKSSTCPHCAEAMTFFEGLTEDSEFNSYFRLVPLETNGSTDEIQENIALAKKVCSYFGESFDGVPIIVIGEKHYVGYASSMDEDLKNDIITSYHNDAVDVVDGIKNGTLKSSNFDAIMTVLIVVVLIGGIGYFIYAARKSTAISMDEEKDNSKKKESNKKE